MTADVRLFQRARDSFFRHLWSFCSREHCWDMSHRPHLTQRHFAVSDFQSAQLRVLTWKNLAQQ